VDGLGESSLDYPHDIVPMNGAHRRQRQCPRVTRPVVEDGGRDPRRFIVDGFGEAACGQRVGGLEDRRVDGLVACRGHSSIVTTCCIRDAATEYDAQWHPTRNGDLTPTQVLAGTNAKVWWRCEQGHEWEATVDSRTRRGTGCPVHAGRQVLTRNTTHTDPAAHMVGMSTPRPPEPGQSLADKFFDISAQWHPTRNGDLTPAQVLAGTNAKVWCRCVQGHEWETAVHTRTSQDTGCPVCAGLNLLTGDDDLVTTLPGIAAQWHPTKNGDLTPDRVTAGSEIRVWWRCEQGHEWKAAVILRIYGSFGCPVCAERFTAGEVEGEARHNDRAT